MNLEQVQEHLRTKQGQIKAWVLSGTSLVDIMRGLGIGIDADTDPVFVRSLFDIPIVRVAHGTTEGVLL